MPQPPREAHDKPAFGACQRCASRELAIALETQAALYVRCGVCGIVTEWTVNPQPIHIRRKPGRRVGEH